MVHRRLKQFSIFEICIRYRLCRRESVFGIAALGALMPFMVYCLYFREAAVSVQYHEVDITASNESSRFPNRSSVESNMAALILLSTETLRNGSDGVGTTVRGSTLAANSSERLCPEESPYLVGDLGNLTGASNHTDLLDIQEFVRNNGQDHIHKGGWWEPIRCEPRRRVAIIIPFRDRMEHLKILLQRLHLVLQRQQSAYRIFVPEQAGTGVFNKARLMNLAFAYVRERFPAYTCIIFHDVDMIPENDRNLYACGSQPRHLSPAVNEMSYILPYEALIGGVLALRPEHFTKVNGYSNLYWGWGGEDDDMYYRMEEEKLKVERPSQDVGRYTMLVHKKREAIPGKIRFKLVWSAKRRYKKDGLAQIRTLNYTIISVSEEPTYTGILIDVGKKT